MQIDHLVVTTPDLEIGAAAVSRQLGVEMGAGGHHQLMGTHNRLLSLGDDCYLEVVAVDPAADAPGRPRWFSLDSVTGTALTHWAVRTDDIKGDLSAAPGGMGDVIDLSRGDLNWSMTVPPSGDLPFEGVIPAILQWHGDDAAKRLPDSGCRLERLILAHPRMGEIGAAWPQLTELPRIATETAPRPRLIAEISTPHGLRRLGAL